MAKCPLAVIHESPAPHTHPPPWTRSGGGLIVRTAPGIEKGQSPAKLGPRPSAMPAGLPSFRESWLSEAHFPRRTLLRLSEKGLEVVSEASSLGDRRREPSTEA